LRIEDILFGDVRARDPGSNSGQSEVPINQGWVLVQLIIRGSQLLNYLDKLHVLLEERIHKRQRITHFTLPLY
jgi:hypothetical protein